MLILKIFITPLLILAVCLIIKKYGATVGGIITGLPIVAGPITAFIYLEQGVSFALDSASATLFGVLPVAAFCFIYRWLALRYGIALTLIVSLCGYLVSAYITSFLYLPVYVSYPMVLLGILIFLYFSPSDKPAIKNGNLSFLNIATRMVAAAILVWLVTLLAPKIGANYSGYLAVFPVATIVMATFSHHSSGEVASLLLGGLLYGLFGLASFYASLIILTPLSQFSIAFVMSLIIALAVQYFCTWQLKFKRARQ